MATNVVHEHGDQLDVVVDHPTSPKSNDLVRVGEKVGVALTDEREDGLTTVKFNGTAEVPVKGVNGSGNSAVAVNDQIFYVDADTPPASKKATGRLAGQAMATVGSGTTATILIRLNG